MALKGFGYESNTMYTCKQRRGTISVKTFHIWNRSVRIDGFERDEDTLQVQIDIYLSELQFRWLGGLLWTV